MQSENISFSRQLVIEHMEPYLFEWCLAEYKQMQIYLQNFDVQLIITNAKPFLSCESKDAREQQDNAKYVKELKECFYGNESRKDKCILIEDSVTQIVQNHQQSRILIEPVCMLDMRGEKQLSLGQKWKTLVFGGILGDHPPRDRPEPVRKHFTQIRHLGPLQLATDTAVLFTRLILENNIKLEDIPTVKEPTIKGLNINGQKTSVQMEGFSYVSKELDIQTGERVENLSKKEKKEIYMSEKVKELLLRDDLDQNLIM